MEGEGKHFEKLSTKVSSSFGSRIRELLSGKENIIVLVGAGISVSCGIPDFRSSQGLYNTLRCEEIDKDLVVAEDLFHLDFFEENPAPFYKFALLNNLFAPRKPSSSHFFLKLLEEQSMLLRVYTQNIDGLEEFAGVSSNRVVYSHGSLKWAQCMRCQSKVDSAYILQQIIQTGAAIPKCSSRKQLNKKRTSNTASRHSAKRACSVSKRSTEPTITNGTDFCDGIMRPGITFFGEKIHSNVNRLLQADRKMADALIVIGTSLSVAPMSQVIHYLPAHIPRILINRNYLYANRNSKKNVVDTTTKDKNCPPSTMKETRGTSDSQSSRLDRRLHFDAYLLGDCDLITNSIAKELGWNTSALTSSHKKTSIVKSATFDNTYLFPGAVLDKNNERGHTKGSSDEEEEQTVTIHCDGCNNEITASMKCNQCFDYDLCGDCFAGISKTHFKGKHSFSPC